MLNDQAQLEASWLSTLDKESSAPRIPRLIKGLAHYVDDIRLPDTLHVAFVRSMYAHARINGIDTTEALNAPGVVAVYTGKDIADKDWTGALRRARCRI